MPSVIPMLSYEDGVTALEWLCRAFGFRERARMQAKDGTLTHGELEFDGGVVMLATPTPDYQSPRRHRESCDAAKRWAKVPFVVDGVLVNVADVDAHFERARAAGARILSKPENVGMGLRHYRAEDLEGHRWMFAQEVADGDRRD